MLLYVAFMKQRFCERLTVRITIIRPEDVIIITNWEIKLFIAPAKAFYQVKRSIIKWLTRSIQIVLSIK